ncbi:MAG: CHASE domain-containing protein [Muricomes sp.]
MAGYKIHNQKRNKVVLSVMAASFLFVICVLFILMLHNSFRQKASLEITQRYRTFEGKVERLIYSNTILLEGFQAYISGNPNMDTDEAYGYLDRLLAGNMKYIRNIGVMEDTTMRWNYPRAGNAEIIGVDLATLEGQGEWVLKVKKTGLPLVQGPINLVQGDSGFSVRIPIFVDGVYWGQTSIVLKASEVLDAINCYASEAGITLAIYSDGKEKPFIGPSEPFRSELVFHMDPSFINWQVHVLLSGGLLDNLLLL